ncbi:hypothetical protein FMN50_15235 [Rhodobacterales bacterium]|nr:hypothetical protein FMN50_15235 [Rhodobacterales bacterium]
MEKLGLPAGLAVLPLWREEVEEPEDDPADVAEAEPPLLSLVDAVELPGFDEAAALAPGRDDDEDDEDGDEDLLPPEDGTEVEADEELPGVVELRGVAEEDPGVAGALLPVPELEPDEADLELPPARESPEEAEGAEEVGPEEEDPVDADDDEPDEDAEGVDVVADADVPPLLASTFSAFRSIVTGRLDAPAAEDALLASGLSDGPLPLPPEEDAPPEDLLSVAIYSPPDHSGPKTFTIHTSLRSGTAA